MAIVLETQLFEEHKIAQTSSETGEIIPIPDFRINALTEFNLVVYSSSDSDNDESFSGPDLTVLYPSAEGDVIGAVIPLVLGEYQAFQVAPFSETFGLSVSVPFWLPDVRIKVFKGSQINMPQSPISPVSGSRISIPQTPINTVAANTATLIAPALPGRNKLTIYNQSNSEMRVRYAAVGTGTSATTAAGGYDEIIAPGYLFEYAATDFPETAINAIWIPPSGGSVSGSCTVTQGVRG